MGETERMTSGRNAARRATQRQETSSASTSRRLSEPLDESGAPVLTAPTPALEERIRQRAYERYLQRQGKPGSPESDWLEAEREVRSAMWAPKLSGPAL